MEASGTPERIQLPSVDAAAAGLYTVAHLAFFSTLANALMPGLDRAALAILAVTVLVAIGRALWRGDTWAALLAMAVLALLAAQLAVFSRLAGQPLNWNAGLAYVPIAGFIVFFNARRELHAFLKALVAISMVYCAAYALFSGIIAGLGGAGILADDGRGQRLLLASGYVGLALFACLVHLRREPGNRGWWLALALVLLALIEAQSRTFSALAALVALLFLSGLLGPATRWVLAFTFTLATAAVLAGVALPGWNPFDRLVADASGQARASAYAALQPLLSGSPITGIGLPGSRQMFDGLLGQGYAYWEDLGAFGVWAAFGLAGLVAFLLLAYRALAGLYPRNAEEEALSLAAVTAALFGVISPSLWSGSATIVANLVVALWLERRTRRIAAIESQKP